MRTGASPRPTAKPLGRGGGKGGTREPRRRAGEGARKRNRKTPLIAVTVCGGEAKG